MVFDTPNRFLCGGFFINLRMNFNHLHLPQSLADNLENKDLHQIREKIHSLKKQLQKLPIETKFEFKVEVVKKDGEAYIEILNEYLIKELQQILETQSLERTHYYINRLHQSLTSIKTGKVNDINLRLWKTYDHLHTDSLWIIENRDRSGAHSAGYWGNFVPQIPNQFIQRYTKKNDWVLDTFAGSGTTLIEANRLGRNSIGVELQSEVIDLAKRNIEQDLQNTDIPNKSHIVQHNCVTFDYVSFLKQNKIKNIQLAILHPPYWDIIKFSADKNDLSNAENLEKFLDMMGDLAERVGEVLEKKRYAVLVIGDKYEGGEWISLAFYTMQRFLEKGFMLKSTIVKNFETTKGKLQQQELWRYRALVGGFFVFKHEYIFVFQKK